MAAPIRSHFTVPSGAQFGAPRQGGRHHQGTDYHCPVGTPIYATGDGRVVSNIGETGYGIGFGNYISLAYPGGRVTLDGHLRERSRLAVGTLVNSSTIVAYVGITGNAIYSDPPGSHDHHQLWINGVLVDPAAYYGITAPAGTGTPIVPEPTPIPKEGKMLIVYGSITGESRKFLIDPFTWTRKEIDSTQASVLGYANIPTIQMVEATMNAIPYAVPAAGIDTASLIAAVVAAVKPYLGNGDATVIAGAVDKALADNFAAIPSAVRAAIIKP